MRPCNRSSLMWCLFLLWPGISLAWAEHPRALVEEMTGLSVSAQPSGRNCQYDLDLVAWLCESERSAPGAVPERSAGARESALAAMRSAGALLIPDSTNKRLMVFSAETGLLIDPEFLVLDDEATGTAIHAVVDGSGRFLISDQTRNVVHRYASDGTPLGVFAPAGGADTSIMQNIRGIALRPNGHLLVSVAAGSNANAIAEFDLNGNHIGNFVGNGSGGLNSPFDIYRRPGTDWLVSSINNNLVKRYNETNGDFIADFAPVSSFPQQIARAANGNVLVANFSGTQGIHEFTPAGVLVDVYNPPGVSGYRGVHELPNGNLLVSTSGGVFEINRQNELVATRYSGQTRFIEPVQLPGAGLILEYTVGTNPSECAEESEITIGEGMALTRCFKATNESPTSLSLHDLVDSELGEILNAAPLVLEVGASIFLTQTAIAAASSTPSAVWTAYNPGPTDVYSSEDSISIEVVPASILLSKTVGLDPSSCAVEDEIEVFPGTAVTYCFEVTNTGLTELNLHDLVDEGLGDILSGFSFNLLPEASVFLTQTAVVDTSTSDSATWTASRFGTEITASSSDGATVTVVPASIDFSKTVGLDSSVCATEREITVEPGTPVTYCFEVTNTSIDSLVTHDLVDEDLGTILEGFSFTLLPGASIFVTQTAVITRTTIASATWQAASAGGVAVAIGSDETRVSLPDPLFWDRFED